MKPLEILEYFEKVQKQRAFLLAALSAFMHKEFEDEDVIMFRLAIAQNLADNIIDGTICVGDDIEKITITEVMEMLKRQNALEQLKQDIKGDNPL